MKFVLGKKAKEEPPINLWLEREGDTVYLMCGGDATEVGGRGEFYILGLCEDGTIRLSSHVPQSLGFKMDDQGRIKCR